ncbi:putative mitochondrial transport protein-like protein [Kockiozyma suomiensis]|uniref:putative mitochondrial transport protein-like protein n=1 Tax=Kockiozyma suomiensis TaxID=1337062 RepID=UPI0033436FA4
MSSAPFIEPSRTTSNAKFRRISSGFISGFASSILLQPLDLLKTRIQQAPNATFRQSLREVLTAQSERSSSSHLDLILKLWRGTIPSVLRTSVGSGLYFATLHSIRATFSNYSTASSAQSTAIRSSVLPRLEGYANLLTGSFTRGAVGFIMMPITVLKVRYESTRYANASLLDTMKSVYREHGIRGFFYGFGATFVRDVPYAGLYVYMYEHAKVIAPSLVSGLSIYDGVQGSETSRLMPSAISAGVNGACAAVAAASATIATNPFDAVKTRMQLFPEKYGTRMWVAFSRMTKEESGVLGLFDGVALRIVRKGFSSAIAWSIYEEMVRRS